MGLLRHGMQGTGATDPCADSEVVATPSCVDLNFGDASHGGFLSPLSSSRV